VLCGGNDQQGDNAPTPYRVSNYAKNRLAAYSEEQAARYKTPRNDSRDLNLSREYLADEQTLATRLPMKTAGYFRRMGKFKPEDMLDCGPAATTPASITPVLCTQGWPTQNVLPHTIEQLLKRTTSSRFAQITGRSQRGLERSGKLASMGQLAAGIAHEVNNP
jgi:hypothetical protein